MVPEHYHNFAKVFSEEESQRLPKHQPWDHAIELEPDAVRHWKVKMYPMLPKEQDELDKFLKEHVTKGYLVPLVSPMASPVFFIKKKDSKLRLVQDYRRLNKITIKNHYPLPLAADIINRLKGAQYFTKFDVQWGYIRPSKSPLLLCRQEGWQTPPSIRLLLSQWYHCQKCSPSPSHPGPHWQIT